MDITVLIETSRLQLIPFSEKYLTPEYVAWLNNPAVVRYSEQRHYKHTLKSCQQYFDSFKKSSNRLWAITLAERHIGNISAQVDTYNNIADIGILIGEQSCWGKGYGFEAWHAVCTYLFKNLQIRKVTAGALSVNTMMIKIFEKMGMLQDGCRSSHYLFAGQPVDIVYYALFNPERLTE